MHESCYMLTVQLLPWILVDYYYGSILSQSCLLIFHPMLSLSHRSILLFHHLLTAVMWYLWFLMHKKIPGRPISLESKVLSWLILDHNPLSPVVPISTSTKNHLSI